MEVNGGDYRTIFHSNNGNYYEAIVNSAARPGEPRPVGTWNGSFTPSGAAVTNSNTGWHMITVVGSTASNSTQYYEDGVLAGTVAGTDFSTDIYSIGSYPSTYQHWFAQYLDDFYFYQSSLTSAQVLQLYDATGGAGAIQHPRHHRGNNLRHGTLDLNGVNTTIAGLNGVAGSLVTLGSGVLTVNSTAASNFLGAISGSGALVNAGTSLLALGGSNSYSGGTTLGAGILQVSGTNTPLGTGPLTFNSGTLQAGSSAILAQCRDLPCLHGDLRHQQHDPGLERKLSGSGGLSKIGSGLLALSGSNSFGGGTTLGGGTLQGLRQQFAAEHRPVPLQQWHAAGRQQPTLANAATLNAAAAQIDSNSDLLTLSGNLSGSGGLVKVGSGMLTLAVPTATAAVRPSAAERCN